MSNFDERAIQGTDVDALEAKSAAVKLGYWKDPYIKYFISDQKTKAPEINRGYFARTQSIEAISKKFITSNNNSQIICIGSGSDTLYLRLINQNILPSKYIEIDLLENVMKKVSQYHQRKVFVDKLHINEKIAHGIYEDPYYLFPYDLRSNPDEFIQLLTRITNLNFEYPTLFIAECVFVYINSESIDRFLLNLSNNFANAAVLSYDPINMLDAFGKVMVSNLKMRHIELNGISVCASKETHIDRFRRTNFPFVELWLISEVYKSFSKETTKRIESIEMLDDPEMMNQLFDHYCLILATKKSELFKYDSITDILSIID